MPNRTHKAGMLLKKLEEIPPFLVFAVAVRWQTKNKRRFTHKEIARRSGLTVRTTQRIAAKISWRGTKIEDVSAFFYGCGLSPYSVFWRKRRIVKSLKMLAGKDFRPLPGTQRKAFFRKVSRLTAIRALAGGQNQSQFAGDTNPHQ